MGWVRIVIAGSLLATLGCAAKPPRGAVVIMAVENRIGGGTGRTAKAVAARPRDERTARGQQSPRLAADVGESPSGTVIGLGKNRTADLEQPTGTAGRSADAAPSGGGDPVPATAPRAPERAAEAAERAAATTDPQRWRPFVLVALMLAAVAGVLALIRYLP